MTTRPPSTSASGSASAHSSKGGWSLFLWANAVFIVYGSLFPFDFQATALPLWNFVYEWHPFNNTADAIDNFFLFVPLGLSICARFNNRTQRTCVALISLMVLGIGIQLLQLYLPGRTSSLADVFWNSLGLWTGMTLYRVLGSRIEQLFNGVSSNGDKFAGMLVALWLFYESFPFVPSLDVGLLREHVKSLFFAPPFEIQRMLEHTVAAILGGMALLRMRLLSRPAIGLACGAVLLLTLEVLVPYGALRREALLGIGIGAALSVPMERWSHQQKQIPLLLLALGMFLLTVVTPYRAQLSDGGFTFTPFSRLLWHSVTKEIPPSAFEALALGSLIWSALAWPPLRERPRFALISVLVLLLGLELLRVKALGFHGDTTAVLIALILFPFARAYRQQEAKSAALPASVERSSQLRPRPETTPHPPQPLSRPSRPFEIAFGIAVLALIVATAWLGVRADADPAWLSYWCLCLCGLWAVPRHDMAGVAVFLLMGYGISSHGAQYDMSLNLRVRDGIAALCLVACLFGAHRTPKSHHPWRSKVAWAALALFGWVIICATAAMLQGTPWGPVLRQDPSTYFQAASMFALTARALQNQICMRILCGSLCAAILGRAWIQGVEGVYLESYVATLLVMAFPMACLGAKLAAHNWERALQIGAAVGMLIYFALAQNRNAGVAALIMALVFCVQILLRYRSAPFRGFAFGLLALAIGAAVFAPSDYLDRFRVLWDSSASHTTASLDRSTAESRLGLWQAALDMAADHPVLGVGPGNFGHFLQFYSPGAGRSGAHNSYLQVLAETGYPGLVFYLLFFGFVLRAQSHVRSRMAGTWQADAAWMLQLSTVAYAALGLFNNRNDLVLAYILAGGSLALYTSTRTAKTKATSRKPPHTV